MKSRSLEARLRGFKAIADLDSGNGQKPNSAANCLVVVVICVAIEIERPSRGSIEGVEGGTVGNIESIVRAGRANGKSAAHLGADGYVWKNTVVNTYRTVRQFVNPLGLESLDENVTRTEEFSDT